MQNENKEEIEELINNYNNDKNKNKKDLFKQIIDKFLEFSKSLDIHTMSKKSLRRNSMIKNSMIKNSMIKNRSITRPNTNPILKQVEDVLKKEHTFLLKIT